jgi:FixJ family two-component response regulator
MKENPPIVFVVDDEPAVCLSLKRLAKSVGLEAQTFTSAQTVSSGSTSRSARLPGT